MLVTTMLNPSIRLRQQNAKQKGKKKVMVTKGVEPSTLALLAPRSNQLS
jgi:hypothetical protein